MTAACVLLAAGCGKRFGGNKLLTEVDGEPMVAHAIHLHASLSYAVRVLVTQPGYRQVIALAEQNGFTVVTNDAPEEGISRSARLGLATAIRQSAQEGISLSGTLFGVCDQPGLTQETVQRLLDAFSTHAERVVAPAANGKRGNPVIFPAALFPAFEALRGDRGGGAIAAQHPELLLLVETEEQQLADVDTKSALPLAKYGTT